MKLDVTPASVSRFCAWAISARTAGGIGRQTSKAGEIMRQVAAARPLTGWKTQPAVGSQVSVVQRSPSSQGAADGLEQLPVEESQMPALWQASWGAQTTGFAPTQRPVVQVSVCVQPSLSLHAVPSGFGVGSHWPAASLHVPSLHWSPKREQSRAVPPHTPALQASLTVQKSPSSQATPSALLGLEQMPVTELQLPASWH